MNNRHVVIEGDHYWAGFYIAEGTIRDISHAVLVPMPVGAFYISTAIKYIAKWKNKEMKIVWKSRVCIKNGPHLNEIRALYIVGRHGEIGSLDTPQRTMPLLRCTPTTQQLAISCGSNHVVAGHKVVSSDVNESFAFVRINWLGELVDHKNSSLLSESLKPDCEVYIQVGLAKPLIAGTRCLDDPKLTPRSFARPAKGNIVVLNIGEISDVYRVRKSQSYEAIAVDLLRCLRGDNKEPNPHKTPILNQLSMSDKLRSSPWSILAIRLNNSAVFLYITGWTVAGGTFSQMENQETFFTERALILCHKSQCAPIQAPELGKMLGYTGFVSTYFGVCSFELANCASFREVCDIAVHAVKESLLLQRAAHDRGLVTMLFSWDKIDNKWVGKKNFTYKRLLKELFAELTRDQVTGAMKLTSDILDVPVDICSAVAHRTPWFMARYVLPVTAQGDSPTSEALERSFREIGVKWLSDGDASKLSKLEDAGIPIVNIGELKLTDRREIEDYLAIYQALQVYGNSGNDVKPMNIAVFGAPGSGKSFGISQVVKYIANTTNGVYQVGDLQFNLSQFSSIRDLPAALHLVRNECLSGRIPIVFFDEFDSSLEGELFGWLKYLLAPMQDGSFYDSGSTYKIGKAVFIFAGGVNRSFEELNGRMRNPNFCEAKGPDFISRLKCHLNVQGVNKPEDDGDQGRFVLRRGVFLHGILRRRLELTPGDKAQALLHRNVARALLKIDRFKHGVRSMESIIKMCSFRRGHEIGPSDLPSMEQLEMHVDASKLFQHIEDELD